MKLFLSTIFLYASILISAQQQDSTHYMGTIILENNHIIPFEIQFIKKQNIINGISITGKGTVDHTISDLTGTYNSKNKTYYLKESQVLSTKSEHDINIFCYINMEIQETGKRSFKRMEGKFTGNKINGQECATGKIIMMEKEKIEKKLTKIKKQIEKIEKRKDHKQNQETLNTKILKEGDDMTINWESRKLTLYLWDGNKEDGDKINLTINNENILTNFETKNKRKKIKYTLRKGVNTIEIQASNLGETPPNTSRIELKDAKTKYPIITQLELNKSATIKIIR